MPYVQKEQGLVLLPVGHIQVGGRSFGGQALLTKISRHIISAAFQ